jgi:hypothetical protein
VQLADEPPIRVVGVQVNALRTGGATVSVAVLVTLPKEAQIVTEAWLGTGCVVTTKLADVCPSGTATLAGPVATAGSLLERLMSIPPEYAGPERLAVQLTEVPPVTVVGAQLNELRTGGTTISMVVLVTPP